MSERETEAGQVTAWLDACRAHPGSLPEGFETVHRRLVRVVGRASLPTGGLAYLKVMAFPRGRDRLRYSVREIPAVREAAMLQRIAALDLGVELPEVLGVVAERRFVLPRLSVLATRGLPVDAGAGPLTVAEAATVGARLAAAGVWQRDFHLDNVLRLQGGRVGLLDVQSSRLLDRPLESRERAEMAVKLLSTAPSDHRAEDLVEAGLVRSDEVAGILGKVRRQRRSDRVRQVLRCVRRSTAFRVDRELGQRLHLRRDVSASVGAAEGIEVGREGLALWLGDRFLEVFDARPPSLAGLLRKAWWRPGPDRVYISPQSAPRGFEGIRSELREGHRRWAAFLSGLEPAETSCA